MHDIGSVMNRRDGRSCLAQKSGCESEKGESSQTSEASSSIPGASSIIPSKGPYTSYHQYMNLKLLKAQNFRVKIPDHDVSREHPRVELQARCPPPS